MTTLEPAPKSAGAPLSRYYRVSGMTCGGCVAGVKQKLEALPAVERAEVDLPSATAHLSLRGEVAVDALREALGAGGKYDIYPVPGRSAEPTRRYRVEGMTCGSCAAKVEQQLASLPEVRAVEVDKDSDTARVTLAVPASMSYLQSALAAPYRLREEGEPPGGGQPQPTTPAVPSEPASVAREASGDEARAWFATYRPLLTIVGLIALTTVLAQAPYAEGLDGGLWMRHFMAGFFIVFAGFKLLDGRGFAESYAMYDVVAERWRGWGLVYPFVELGLGLAYLTNVAPLWTNVATIVILGVSAIGVVRSVLDRRAIKCACLGTGFNLPMSTVTIVEDVSMVGMAAWMLLA